MTQPSPPPISTDEQYRILRLLLLIARQHSRGHIIDGEQLGRALHTLIRLELQPGGPYSFNNSTPDLLLNLCVAQLFPLFGKPLINVHRYLQLVHPAAYSSPTSPLERHPIPSPQDGVSVWHPAILKEFIHYPRYITHPIRASLERTVRKNTGHEILHISSIFANSLHARQDYNQQQLATANALCWTAYSIYDNIFDEQTQTELLPIALLCARRSEELYGSFNRSLTRRIFNTMDKANAWELAHCRAHCDDNNQLVLFGLPRYMSALSLSDRSLGHILGPLLIAKRSATSAQLRAIYTGLRHFLVARQLNDDMHDWQEDLKNGQLSYVVTVLLRRAGVTTGTHQLTDLTRTLQHIFWASALEELNVVIARHLSHSRHYLMQSQLITENGDFFTLLNKLETGVTKARSERQRHQEFLASLHTHHRGTASITSRPS